MLRYQQQDSPQTLAEGLAEYREANPDLHEGRDPDGPGAKFFRCHDVAHVVFGCSTSRTNEALADAWTLFGTSVTLRQFVGFLGIEEHRKIVEEVGIRDVVGTFLRALPLMAVVAWRAWRMTSRWPWAAFEPCLDVPLSEIRRRHGIRIVRAP